MTYPNTSVDHSLASAEYLRRALERHGIAADIHNGYGLAVVSVWVGLLVWCDGRHYWWRTGWNARRKHPVYAWHPVVEPARAARRVALRYTDLRAQQAQTTDPREADGGLSARGPR